MSWLCSHKTDARARLSALTLGVSLALLAPVSNVRADSIYNMIAQDSNDFIPFENDGTPNRPFGSELGNEITFGGIACYSDHVQVVFASIGPKEFDTYTLDLYKNDGQIDPSSGLPEPGTLISQLTTHAWNIPLPGNGAYGVDWYFSPMRVPDTLTAVVSSPLCCRPSVICHVSSNES
jgi:hypothetical protein